MSDVASHATQDVCEICCKNVDAGEDTVPVNPVIERLVSTGSCKAHRYCWQVARGLGSVNEARQLFAVRSRAREQKRYIVIKPPRVTINAAQFGSLFAGGKRPEVMPA